MANEANMRIVCTTERAFDNTTAILDFLGSGEYAVDKEKKTIELNVSSWDYYRLIDIIHFQFTEELGERAWRKEIDMFHINEGGSDYKIEKSPKTEKPPKRVMHLVFGEYASKRITECSFPDDDEEEIEDDLEEVLDCMRNCDAAYVVREYETEAEEKAYIDALNDLNGWTDYALLEDVLMGEDIEKFDKMMDEIHKEDKTATDAPFKYLDCELYHVEYDTENKVQIHIDGYCYWNEESHQCVQSAGCYVSVEELEACSNDEEKLNLLSDAFENSKQYQGEISKEEVAEYYKEASELRMEKVTKDTPVGWYVHY